MEQQLYDLPDGWSWKKFKDVCLLRRGYDLPKKSRMEGRYPLFSANGVTDHIDQFKVRGPGVVTGRSGTIGKVHFVDADFWPLNTALYVENFRGNDARFIHYFLKSFDLGRFASGAAVPTLNRNSLSAEDVCVPDSVEEQKRIVAKLDALFTRIDAAITHLQKTLELSKALFASALDVEFATLEDRFQLADIAQVKGGKRLPKGDKLQDGVTSHPYIRVSDFTDNGTIDPSGVKYICDETYEKIKRYTISSDDLYISIAGTIGKTGVIPGELDGANLTENAAKLVFKEMGTVNVRFVYYFTLSHDFLEQAGLATKVVAQPKLALTRLSKIEVPIPALREQNRIVGVLDTLSERTRALEAETQDRLNQLTALKSSLLDAAFRGQL